MQNVNMVLKKPHSLSQNNKHHKTAKSERHQYNRQLQDYCNDLCDKKMKMTKMRRKHHGKKLKTLKSAVYNNIRSLSCEHSKKKQAKHNTAKNDFIVHGI